MVSVGKGNAYELREYVSRKLIEDAGTDPFKLSWLFHLGLIPALSIAGSNLSLYQRCSIAGLRLPDITVSGQDIDRLLGQAARIEGTPMPWVSDVYGVTAVRWLADALGDGQVTRRFSTWCEPFLSQQIAGGQFTVYEHDMAQYVRNSETATFSSASVPLLLHYLGKLRLSDHREKSRLTSLFMMEFRACLSSNLPVAAAAGMVFVFDKLNADVALVPPNGWAHSDLISFLQRISVGLKKWTWEDTARTKGGNAIKWPIENEYHVQNFLYALLGPIFSDITGEMYLEPVGQKTPRVDLYLPSLHAIIEVKFRKDSRKSFSALIGEVAEDASLYRSDARYTDATVIVFLWDHTRSTQEHPHFIRGVEKIQGIDACVVINSPSSMQMG